MDYFDVCVTFPPIQTFTIIIRKKEKQRENKMKQEGINK